MTYDRTSRILRSGAFAALVTLLTGFHAAAQPQRAAPLSLPSGPPVTIGWAAGAFGNQTDNAPAKNVLFPPDGKGTFVSRAAWLLTATFTKQFTYWKLAAALDVPADTLKSYDIIAFEGNSQEVPFENSIWFVTDNVSWAAGTFLGDVKPPNDPVSPQSLKFLAGKMSVATYKDVFENVKEIKDAQGRPLDWVGWILVDIPDRAKMDPAGLKVFLTGVHRTSNSKLEGSPGPDAIGLIVH